MCVHVRTRALSSLRMCVNANVETLAENDPLLLLLKNDCVNASVCIYASSVSVCMQIVCVCVFVCACV